MSSLTSSDFLQVIEGEKEMIKGLFKTISSDPRHSQVDLI